MDYIEILQEMLSYIDTHIREKLSVEKLAARAGFSPYHFCRVFQWEVGYSIMEYVRDRRLAYAAAELSTGRRIVDIAVDYGFETHSGFSKAFRRYFGCPPEVYRMHASFDIPKLPILSRNKRYLTGGIVMEPKMLKKGVVKLAGFALNTRTKGGENKKAIPQFWTDYLSDGRMQKLHGESFLKSHAEYGACFPENPGNGEFVYVIGVEVKEGRDIPDGYHVCTLPEALYAVFSTPPADESKFSPAIQGTWDYIMSEWFPNSGYEFDGNGVDFELYDERCKGKTGKVCDIYIPVVKKQVES
ncbi:MAG: AraC family transcriptional regulator [Treponema sp.]|nr:AraC family transcriptional regulator [Treponema sp.]